MDCVAEALPVTCLSPWAAAWPTLATPSPPRGVPSTHSARAPSDTVAHSSQDANIRGGLSETPLGALPPPKHVKANSVDLNSQVTDMGMHITEAVGEPDRGADTWLNL